jgi:hypothetical protein
MTWLQIAQACSNLELVPQHIHACQMAVLIDGCEVFERLVGVLNGDPSNACALGAIAAFFGEELLAGLGLGRGHVHRNPLGLKDMRLFHASVVHKGQQVISCHNVLQCIGNSRRTQ